MICFFIEVYDSISNNDLDVYIPVDDLISDNDLHVHTIPSASTADVSLSRSADYDH